MNKQIQSEKTSVEFSNEVGTGGLFYNDDLLHVLVAARGSTIELKTVNGKTFNGVFYAINEEGCLTVSQCGIVNPDGSNRITIDGQNLVMEAELITMIFELPKIASFTLQNVNDNFTIKDKKPVASVYNGAAGKQFQPWKDDNCSNALDMSLSLDDSSNGWSPEEMFSANKNSKKSTYDPKLSQYTTALQEEDTAEYAKRKEVAAQKAREIEKSKEYNKNISREISDESEESKFSSVDRNEYIPSSYRSEQMRKNNRGVKHNNNNTYYQQPPAYNKIQRNMPPPQQQLDLNSVAKITRKVEVSKDTSDKFNRGQDSSRSAHSSDARNSKYSDRPTNNTKTYAYQQTSKQDDSGRYALKDRPALNSNNVVQNFSKPDENKITSTQKPQNVEPLAGRGQMSVSNNKCYGGYNHCRQAPPNQHQFYKSRDNDSKAKGDHVLAVNSNKMMNQNDNSFAKSTGHFTNKQPAMGIQRRKNSPDENKRQIANELKAFNENFKLADNPQTYHLDNRASAPPPSTYKSPPSQHPNNARPQVPPQHIVTKSNSYTHETGHYQHQQAYKPPQVVRTVQPSAQWQQGYSQYPVNVNQPQEKPAHQGNVRKEMPVVKKQPSINVPPANKSQPEKSPGVKTFYAASQYPPQPASSSQQSSTPPTTAKPQQPVESSNMSKNDVTKVEAKEEKKNSTLSTNVPTESATGSTSTLNPNAKEFKFNPTNATATKPQPAVTPVVQNVLPETSHPSGYPQQPQPMTTMIVPANQPYRHAPIPHGPPAGYVAFQPAPLPPNQQPQFIQMDYPAVSYRNQQYSELPPGAVYSAAPNFPPVHVPIPPQQQQVSAQPPQPYMRTSSAQPQVMPQPPPQMILQPHHPSHHHQMVPQHIAAGGQPVYTPTAQQPVVMVARQHPGPSQGGMMPQGQHPQPSPSAGSAYIHQSAVHHQMAPPQQPQAGPPQQQYIQQQHNMSWPSNNGGQSYPATH